MILTRLFKVRKHKKGAYAPFFYSIKLINVENRNTIITIATTSASGPHNGAVIHHHDQVATLPMPQTFNIKSTKKNKALKEIPLFTVTFFVESLILRIFYKYTIFFIKKQVITNKKSEQVKLYPF